MDKKIILWGATGQAKVLSELFHRTHDKVVAVFDNNPQITQLSPHGSVPLFHGQEGFRKWKEMARPDMNLFHGLAAIGGANGRDRVELQKFFESNNVLPINAIHPTAFMASDARIGEACQILANATICAEVTIGNACIINSSATVEHECVLGTGVHIGPGATLAGIVHVGEYSFIGTGAVVLPRIKIGKNVIVGAGAVVTKDVEDNLVVAGNPARVLYRK